MAKFAKVNGDLLPVLNVDTGSYVNSGVNAVQSGATVQPQGPALGFFTVTGVGHLTGTQVAAAIQSAQQLATIHIYEFLTGATNDVLYVAMYPIDAWTTATLQASVRAGLTATGQANAVTVTAGATFSMVTYPPTGATAPFAPTVGTATALTASTATVAFTANYDGGSDVTSFDVITTPSGGTGTGTSSPISISGLTTGTEYTFQVTATNVEGTSVPSDPSNAVTTP